MAQNSSEAVEMNKIIPSNSRHTDVPESNQDVVSESAEQQNPEAHEEEHPMIDPVGLADGTETQSELIDRKDEWISKWLRWPITVPTVLVTIGLMGATIGLAARSIHRHGIISTNADLEVDRSFLTFQFGLSLLWTSVPSFLFQLYALTIAKIVKEASVRQPYVELRRPLQVNGVAAEKSILLDYQSYWLPRAPLKALQYNHYMLAYSFVIVLVLNISLAPLTGHLFFAATVSRDHDIDVTKSAALNWESGGTPYSMSPVFSTVSRTLTYGGQPFPWTTFDKSFVRVEIPGKLTQGNATRNLTVPVDAYAAEVDCRVLGPDEFEMGTDDQGAWYYSFKDRGCSAQSKGFTPAVNQFLLDLVHTYNPPCNNTAGYYRILVIGAQHRNRSSDDLVNRTAISCIPSYSRITGSLTMSVDPLNPDNPSILDLSDPVRSIYPIPPSWATIFEQQMVTFDDYLDPTSLLSATAYGEVIYNEIKKLNPKSYLSGETLLNATASTFVAGFAITANMYLIQSAAPRTLQGIYSSDDTRVFVDLAVAWTVTALLALALLMLGWIISYTNMRLSILYEEPKAMITPAVTTWDSELKRRIALIDVAACRGKVGEKFIKDEKDREADPDADKGYIFENWQQPSKACLASRPKAEPFGYFKKRT